MQKHKHEFEKAIRQKWNKIGDQTKEGYFTVEKASSSIRGLIQHIFGQMLVNTPDNGLNTLWVFLYGAGNLWIYFD